MVFMNHFCKITFSSSTNVNSLRTKEQFVWGGGVREDVKNYFFLVLIVISVFLFLRMTNKLGKD